MTSLTGAVVGCGRMGAVTSDSVRTFAPSFWLPLSHCEAMQTHPAITLAAVCDVNEAALCAARVRFDVPHAYRDYQVMIDEVAPQLLGIATRTPQRPDIIRYAIEHRVRALHIEKPLCNSVQQLLELERLLSPPELACTYGTLRRYMPRFRRARELVQSGAFGELQQVQVCFGRAQLLWAHPHALDVLLFMAGDAAVARVSARFATAGLECSGSSIDGDPHVLQLLVEFETGVTGLISESGGLDVMLSCSAGSIAVEADGHRLRCRRPRGEDPYWFEQPCEGDPENAAATVYGGTGFALNRLVAALQGNLSAAEVATDKQAILAGQRLLFAAAQSHLREGIAVDVAVLDPDLMVSGRSHGRFA